MRWFILMVGIISVVHCRPQHTQNTPAGTPVELEKQTLVELKAINQDQKTIQANTNEILEKIAEVNKKQGTPKKQSNNYFNIPSSLSRSQDEPIKRYETARSDFRFPTNPFSNPIFEYLERNKQTNDNEPGEHQSKYVVSNNRQSQEYPYPVGYEVSSTDHNAKISEEDLIPGQYVKRKIVHQQSVLVPNPNYFAQPMMPNYPQNVMPYPAMPTPVVMSGLPFEQPQRGDQNSSGEPNFLSDLERQTIDNIKNIVSNSQLRNQVYPGYYNPYEQQIGNIPSDVQYGFYDPNKEVLGQSPPVQNPGYQIYGPFPAPNQEQARQNWNWPGANFFPIYIKDPFLQMYNAVTSMIEYGPNAGMQNPCPASRPANKNKLKSEALLREGKTADPDQTKISVEVNGDSISPQITINGLNSSNKNGSYLDIENLDIGTGKDNSMKFTVSVKTDDRVGKDSSEPRSTWDKVKVTGKTSSLVLNASRAFGKPQELPKDLRPITIFKNQQMTPKPTQTILSPPIRDPTHQTEEFGDESEEDDKSEELISNDHNKKLFSRDNTGSGVFIHKLKVRKGGVAIAGPGGIATAGSGGTAIVGPNGIAYTQPDSLAIAGSGTKVIAVDPAVNLGELVNSTLGGNRTRLEGLAHSRVGKVVAVGPVVYYNKG